MTVKKWLIRGLVLAGLASPGFAPRALACGPDALGVSRELPVGGAPRVGLKTYPNTLALGDHEVILTFDDGPSAATRKVLDALDAHCAKATFFLIGRNAEAMPELVRREIAAGHTVGSHSWSHPLKSLRALDAAAGVAEIERGDRAVQAASGGKASHFFRFPGFGDSPALLEAAAAKHMPVFGTDLWASDWNPMTSERELNLLMGRLRKAGRGMILLHDIHRQTADMIPALLRALKAEGFRLVHLVPGPQTPELVAAPAGWSSETEAFYRKMFGAPPPALRPSISAN
jgi:peptidoglycan/xylan/chitin deacetylase (PgdA/CDA1 family)